MKLLVVVVSYRVTDLTIDCLRSLSSEIERVPGTRVALCENGTGGNAAELDYSTRSWIMAGAPGLT